MCWWGEGEASYNPVSSSDNQVSQEAVAFMSSTPTLLRRILLVLLFGLVTLLGKVVVASTPTPTEAGLASTIPPHHVHLPHVQIDPTATPTVTPTWTPTATPTVTPTATPTITPTPTPQYTYDDAVDMVRDISRVPLNSPTQECYETESTYPDIAIWYECEYWEWRGLNAYVVNLQAGVADSVAGAQRAHEEQIQRLRDRGYDPEVHDTWMRTCLEMEVDGLPAYGCLRSRFDGNMVRKVLVVTLDNTSLELLEATDF